MKKQISQFLISLFATGMISGMLFAQSGSTRQVNLTASAPAPAAITGISVTGTPGKGTACYWVVTNFVAGAIMSSGPQCITNVPNTLSSSNLVNINWSAAQGAVSYDLLKTPNPSTLPRPGATTSLQTGLTVTSATDQGGSLSAYTAASYPNSNVSMVLRLNNRDYAIPTIEIIAANYGDWLTLAPGNGTVSIGANGADANINVNIAGRGTGTVGFGTNSGGFDPTGALVKGVYSVTGNILIAGVNAGTVILPAVTGQTITIVGLGLQALGGAVATCTAVVVEDTNGTPVVGYTAPVATLTQGTVVNLGTSGTTAGTIWAPLTANQGLQIGKTGGTCATATSVQYTVFYKINS